MRKKILAGALLLLLSFFAVLPAGAQLRFNFGKGSPLRKLQMAELAISNLYVDTVNENKLVEDGIRGMLEKLDPHSSYSPASEAKSLEEGLNGGFDGIGVQFNMLQDTLVVVQTVVKGPSEKVGILPGDRIVAVNDTAIAGVKMDKAEIMRRLRGRRGTVARLKIIRRGVNHPLTFNVVRDKIPLKTLDAAYMIRPGIGYIRLSSFGMKSDEEVAQALDSLKKQGMKDLIFDLQDNGGGYLQAAVAIAQEFLQPGDLIVYTQGRVSPRQDFNSGQRGRFRDGRIVVLINEFSASAAEIVTGSIQDQDRGSVVGRRSFGKGLVQRPIPFEDGSMMRLTVAHYYTPSGRCIQKPYKKGDLKDYEMDFDNRYKHGELTNVDSIHLDKSHTYYTLRKHRPVYGGGGIMPDVFVPLDTLQYTAYHRKLMMSNVVMDNYLRYVDNNRKALKKSYKTFDDFNKDYTVPDDLIAKIREDGKKQKVEPKDDAELQRTLPYLKLQLKALVARDLWDMNEYFKIMNESNAIVKKGIDVLTGATATSRP
ncbi:MAG: S41 family peptidase [Prevotellaceae bacterium]|nr:S41 family peptidase [Prevotellaceae bacterium]